MGKSVSSGNKVAVIDIKVSSIFQFEHDDDDELENKKDEAVMPEIPEEKIEQNSYNHSENSIKEELYEDCD